MITINLSRDAYSTSPERHEWISNNIGEWTWSISTKWFMESDSLVRVAEAFGYYSYTFKNESDSILFALRWSKYIRD